MKKDEREYILDILDNAEILTQLAAKGKEALYDSYETRGAVLYYIAILGEAAKQVSPEIRALAPEIPWRSIAGTRDIVIHGYSGVNLEIVWEALVTQLEPLKGSMRNLLSKLDSLSEQ